MSDIDAHLDDWPAWPTYGLIDDLLPTLARWSAAGEVVALATLVDIVGSSPRPLGSEMAITASGCVAGYVSGGCVEGAVAAEARQVLASGRPRLLDYGAGSPVLDVQLTCGGRIGIYVRAVPDLTDFVAALQQARTARRAAIVDIDMADGRHCVTTADVDTPVPENGFRQTYLPPCRLIAVGNDPVTLALCHLAGLFGLQVGLVRPYGPSSAPPSTPLFHYDTRPLNAALPDLPLDRWTALYALTHDMDDDHRILEQGLRSAAFRVGALGSQGKTRERLDYLTDAGFDASALERLDTPAGLDIGARNPREIALSILAGITATRPIDPVPIRLSTA
ncbi:MAG: XdhC family protein [Salinisphaera sp.]|nr:XdhC family protein [Salinisphaera sp.]